MTEFETPHRSQRIGYGRTLHFVMARWLREPRDLSRTLMGIAVATACDVMMPVAAGWLISAIAPIGHSVSANRAASLHAAIWAVSAMAILGLLSVVGRRSMYVGITKLSTRVMRSVLTEGFDRVQHFSTDWHANTFAGSTVRRLTRGMWALDTVDDVLLLALLPQILVLGGTAGVLTCRDPLMGAILVISILLFVALSIALTIFYVSPTSRVSNQWDSRVGAAIADAITCNATVKSFGAEVREKLRLHHVMEMWQQRTRKSWIRGTDSGNLQALASLLMRFGLIAIVTWRWWEGRADAGQVAYVLTMVFLIQGYLRDLGNQVSQLQRGVNEMEEMVAIFDHETDVADTAHARDIDIHRGGIRFDKVTFVYPGTTRSLFTDFSVSIEGGTSVALVGRSGSGKSSFVKLLQRLYDPQGGSISIDGMDLRDFSLSSLRGQIAIVPQDPALFHRSLAENIAYGNPTASMADIERAAKQANAHDFITHLPEGYKTLVGERGIKLSGGERQRVAIARAFLADAPIVIFDEATSSLDSQSELLVKEAMDRLMLGRTVIVIAHRLTTVRSLDRIIVFQQGRIVEDGSHDALLNLPDGVYNHLYRIQAHEGHADQI